MISNLIFHANMQIEYSSNFVKARQRQSSSLLNAKFTFKRTSPPIIFARIVRPSFASRCYG